MLLNELFEAASPTSAGASQEAKELISKVDTPSAINKAVAYLNDILKKINPEQKPNDTDDMPVAESPGSDKQFAIDAIEKIAASGNEDQLNAVINFLRTAELTELATAAINARLTQGVKGGLDQKLVQIVQSLNTSFEKTEAILQQMASPDAFWDGTLLLQSSVGNVYDQITDPIVKELAKKMSIQLRGAMGYGPDQGPGEFMLALTGSGVDLADKSDLVLVDGKGVEVKADNGGIVSTKTGKKSRSGGRLYSTSGYGTAVTAKLVMYEVLKKQGITDEELQKYGWPKRIDGQEIIKGGLNFNAAGVNNLNNLINNNNKINDKRASMQSVMAAFANGLYLELPVGMISSFLEAVPSDGIIDYQTMMKELVLLGHEYYKKQEGHDYIMIFNTQTGKFGMMGDEKTSRDIIGSNKIKVNSGMDMNDDRSKGTPQLLTNF